MVVWLRNSVEDRIKSIKSVHRMRCRNELLRGLQYTQMKMKEPVNSFNSHLLDFSVELVCEPVISKCFHCDIKALLECHLKSVQIKKTVVKNCFILGAGKREKTL